MASDPTFTTDHADDKEIPINLSKEILLNLTKYMYNIGKRYDVNIWKI